MSSGTDSVVVQQTVPARTEQHENRARWHRQAALTTTAAIISRVVAIGVRLLTIPMALHLLGPERYGLWLTVGSILMWIGFVGPGIGYGLINALSEASGRDDKAAMQRHISTAVLTIGLLAVLVLGLVSAISKWPGLPKFLGIVNSPELAGEAVQLMAVAGVLFGLTFSLEFLVPICSGLQEGYLTSIALAAANVLGLAGVACIAWLGGSLITFALVVGGPPIVANLALACYLFFKRHPHLRPSWRLWNVESFHVLMSFGGWMFLCQIAELAIFQSANVLIANRFGPAEVPRYAVPAAVFMSITNICYSIVQPYWPAVTEATVRGDWAWIRTSMFQTLKLRTGIILAAGLGMIIIGPAFIRVWSANNAVPSRGLLVAMSVYFLFVVWTGNSTVLLLGFGLVRLKAMLAAPVGLAHIVGFYLLSGIFGLAAFPVAGSVAVLMECVVSAWIALRYLRAQEESIAATSV